MSDLAPCAAQCVVGDLAGPMSNMDAEFSIGADVLAVTIRGEVGVLSACAFSRVLGDVPSNAPGAAVIFRPASCSSGRLACPPSWASTAQRKSGVDSAMPGSHAVLGPLQVVDLDLRVCENAQDALARVGA